MKPTYSLENSLRRRAERLADANAGYEKHLETQRRKIEDLKQQAKLSENRAELAEQ